MAEGFDHDTQPLSPSSCDEDDTIVKQVAQQEEQPPLSSLQNEDYTSLKQVAQHEKQPLSPSLRNEDDTSLKQVAQHEKQPLSPSIYDEEDTIVKQVAQHEFYRKEVNPDETTELSQVFSRPQDNVKKDMLEFETDINLIKEAIRHNYTTITENLRLEQVLPKLYAKRIITEREKQHIQGENKGNIAKCEVLIDYLCKKPDWSIREFLAVLKTSQPYQYAEINTTVQRISKGEISACGNEIAELQDELMRSYREKKIHMVTSIPGESFVLDLTKTQYVMPLVFSTQVKRFDGPAADMIRKDERKFKYQKKDYELIEDIFKDLGGEKKQILCLGPAGNGKSVLSSRLVCQWMDNSEKSNKLQDCFDLVLTIPLRDVDTAVPFIEMVGQQTRGLKYFNHDRLDTLKKYLETESRAKRVLTILDGLDEVSVPKDSELFQIIHGTKYPHMNVLCTCRPEAETDYKLQSTGAIDFMVNLDGTTEKGVHDYLSAILSSTEGGPTEEEVSTIVKKCHDHMLDFGILQTPLYLTFLGYTFHNYWVKHSSFVNFKIPKSTTDVLNACMRVLLRIWMKRLNEPEEIEFERNPSAIGDGSTVPNDIKAKLILFAELCYHSLIEEKYEFNSADFDQYLIATKDIIDSGMFASSHKDGKFVYYLRHKIFQEYIAAMHLSRKRFQEQSFLQMIENATSNNNRKCLVDVLSKLTVVFQFLCGIDPQFAAEVIKKLQGCVSIPNEKSWINISYESLLVTEAADSEFNEAMFVLINSKEVTSGYDKQFCKYPIIRVQHFINALTIDQCASLLQKWYNLNGKHWVQSKQVQQKKLHTTNFNISRLNETLFFLLLRFKPFPEVKFLTGYPPVADLKLLTLLFPHVSEVNINCRGDPSSKLSELTLEGEQLSPLLVEPAGKLTHVTINSRSPTNLTDSEWTSIMEQSALNSLNLCTGINYAPSPQFQPTCNNIQRLTVFDHYLYASQCVVTDAAQTDVTRPTLYKGISLWTWLLQFTPHVTELNLGCMDNHTSVQSQSDLIHSIASHLKQLNILRIYTILLEEDIVKEFLHTVVPTLTHLHTLGLGCGIDFKGEMYTSATNINILIETLKAQPTITTVELVYHDDQGWLADIYIQSMKGNDNKVQTKFIKKPHEDVFFNYGNEENRYEGPLGYNEEKRNECCAII